MLLLNISLYQIPLSLIVPVLFAGILFTYYIGVKIARYINRKNPDAKADGIGPMEGALLGLLSLLLSFTFSMSASRYDARRAFIVQEANDIGTVILRADLYADSVRIQFRNDLHDYVETRISYYDATDEKTSDRLRSDAEKISSRIWARAVAVKKQNPDVVRDGQMIPAIGTMMDIVSSRDAARLATVPGLIIYLLIILTLLGSFIVGYGKKEKKHDWIIISLYASMTVLTLFTILDLDRPRSGIIRTLVPHQKIDELRNYFLPDASVQK